VTGGGIRLRKGDGCADVSRVDRVLADSWVYLMGRDTGGQHARPAVQVGRCHARGALLMSIREKERPASTTCCTFVLLRVSVPCKTPGAQV